MDKQFLKASGIQGRGKMAGPRGREAQSRFGGKKVAESLEDGE